MRKVKLQELKNLAQDLAAGKWSIAPKCPSRALTCNHLAARLPHSFIHASTRPSHTCTKRLRCACCSDEQGRVLTPWDDSSGVEPRLPRAPRRRVRSSCGASEGRVALSRLPPPGCPALSLAHPGQVLREQCGRSEGLT